MRVWRDMAASLAALESAGLLRRPAVIASACGPKVVVDGREVVCLCSNDYLHLASDAAVVAAAAEGLRRWGVGAGASRLVCGTQSPHVELENTLAGFKRVDAAVVTPTGWMANHVALHALATAGDLVLCDKLNHASIIDAATSGGARVRTYAHRNTARLEALLRRRRSSYRRCVIVTDSLFSMDGDLAPLAELVEIKKRFDALLVVDEAHATGVLGPNGRGAAELLGVEDEIDVTVGTLSKAIGCVGGFVAGPAVLAELIRNSGRAYVYTTALPPAVCTAALAAIGIIRTQPQRRDRLLAMADRLRARLRAAGLDTGNSVSQIIPIVIGRASEAVRISAELLRAGFLVPAIRPPTVPRGASRLRVSLCADHDEADLERFSDVLAGL